MTRLEFSAATLAARGALLSLLLCVLAPTAGAQMQPDAAPPAQSDPAVPAAAQSDPDLPAWDQLSAAQREQLIGPLRERWDSQPQTRAHLFRNAQRWQQMTPQQRERAQRGLERLRQMTPEQRQQAREAYQRTQQLPEAERRSQREQMRQVTPEQRRQRIRERRGNR